MTLKLLDTVVLKNAMPADKLRSGALGTIVEIFGDGVYLVEFADTKGIAYAIVELTENQLLKVHHEPMAMAA